MAEQTIEPYDAGLRGAIFDGIYDGAMKMGLGRGKAGELARMLSGENSFGFGLADFVPAVGGALALDDYRREPGVGTAIGAATTAIPVLGVLASRGTRAGAGPVSRQAGKIGAGQARRAGRTATPGELPSQLSSLRGGKSAGGYLTPEEASKLGNSRRAQRMLDIRASMPTASELATAAQAGGAKRGWYQGSAEALDEVLGEDARRFAMLLASTSPQTSVESNLLNTANIWSDWIRSQRPQDVDEILEIMGRQVQGNKGIDSVLPAWRNNSIYSLTLPEDQLEFGVLSGPKVDSFARNLAFPYRGALSDSMEVTNDTWQGRLLGVPQTMFSGTPNVARTDPGKGPGYLAANSLTRQAADILSDRTGSQWTPSEVQESAWSFAKALRERALSQGMQPIDFLRGDMLTDSMIADTPDFATLLRDPGLPYRAPFEDAGYTIGSAPAVGALSSNTTAELMGMGGRRREELLRAARRLANDPNR